VDVDDKCAGQTWLFGTERPLVPATTDPDAMVFLLGHSYKPGAGEGLYMGRRSRQVEGVDVLVGLIELPDQHICNRVAPQRYRRKRDIAGPVVDLQRGAGCENAVEQVRAVLVLGVEIVPQDDLRRQRSQLRQGSRRDRAGSAERAVR